MMRIREIKKIAGELKKIKEIKAVYLFGSYAMGTATPMSDIDVCVVVERDISDDKKADIVSLSSDRIDVSMFWDLPIFIRHRVLKDGKILFERDEGFLNSVRVLTLREYFDFKPMIERFSEVYFGDKEWIERR
ncbi:MAG: nucleotidyltransferase domain-containing protein [Candidatus Aenigmarchaeota archaeon]|nr:nucleotidyltransferase domain-containing protein [Candidatus Aenigmarchaeota archaeon]NCO97144.1 nucleotidyltransferase domain-containing protein [Candidatus Aenigmarchaeota archaeon]OIN86246.1 MAG: hypothetical protein AUJ50_04190 [Candidatus Aenigmarchaeota archaeon CG1_02_38_14]